MVDDEKGPRAWSRLQFSVKGIEAGPPPAVNLAIPRFDSFYREL